MAIRRRERGNEWSNYRVPQICCLVDGSKNKRCRPGDPSEQVRAYDGYKKTHASSVIVFFDIFGTFIGVEISNKEPESDRNMKKSTEVYKNPKAFLSNGQYAVQIL